MTDTVKMPAEEQIQNLHRQIERVQAEMDKNEAEYMRLKRACEETWNHKTVSDHIFSNILEDWYTTDSAELFEQADSERRKNYKAAIWSYEERMEECRAEYRRLLEREEDYRSELMILMEE